MLVGSRDKEDASARGGRSLAPRRELADFNAPEQKLKLA